MEIKIQMRRHVLCFQFGKKTEWFESVYWMTIIKEYYDENKQVAYADLVYGAFRL